MKQRKIESIPTENLIKDYKEIQQLESDYWKILKKYEPESTFESDAVTVEILLELGRRQIG